MRAVGSQGETRDIARSLLAHVTYQRLLGAVGAPAASAPAPAATAVTPRAAERPAPSAPRAAAAAPVDAVADAARETLDGVRADLGDCQRCKLAGGRTNLVFGVGDPHARLVFVGEGPGADRTPRASRSSVVPASC